VRPPATPRGDVVDDHFGEPVADPYRWLEDTGDPAVVAWTREQAAYAERHLAALPAREALRRRLTQLWSSPRAGVPWERGGTWLQWRNPGLDPQPVLWTMGSPTEVGRPLLDPGALPGSASVPTVSLSPDGRLLAWARSDAGSDWLVWRVRDVALGVDLPEELTWSKYCDAAWTDDGFFYGRLPVPEPGEELLEQARGLAVWHHRVGTDQAEDTLAVPAPAEPDVMPFAQVTEDGRWLVVTLQEGTRPEAAVHVRDLTDPAGVLVPLVADRLSTAEVVATAGTTFTLRTDWQAERGRLVSVDLADPRREAWRELVGEGAGTLRGAVAHGGALLLHSLVDAQSRLTRHALDGTPLGPVDLPPAVSVTELSARAGSPVAHVLTASFTDPGSLWSLTGDRLDLLVRRASAHDPADFVTEQVFVPSDDGTVAIPLFLTRHRDTVPTGEVPVLLYGYGGFDHAMTPAFSATFLLWAEQGGLLAVACLRGGGEYGSTWHDAGRRAHKQNVFDDAAACARWLAGSSGWSRPARVGLTGRSNGGLLAGACLTQHPELFGAVVPEVGVLDMLRFHLFTVGWAWTSDYGDPAVAEEHAWVRAYSPLHAVTPGTAYPPTLVTTGDHDDRVAPGHSFKMAAALQAAQAGAAPVLLRVDTAAGHGAGKPTAQLIAERVDVLSFLGAALGLHPGSADLPGPGPAP